MCFSTCIFISDLLIIISKICIFNVPSYWLLLWMDLLIVILKYSMNIMCCYLMSISLQTLKYFNFLIVYDVEELERTYVKLYHHIH
jgi:hypothetical protein